ncbi:gp37 [Burkholderia phage BcepB1A]|uniref:gp37 n=1 Tax=Burkholderia phage BcepB1A TaxID=279530 RepID=UPI000053EA61|nr:gp37 [Burkholderia phage BcepB1A]AAY87913.1 gp37 [Burkholderia phage BcepB1A]
MNKTHLRTYSNHIRAALVNRRDALKLELAVMFAVTLESDGNKRLAREAIYSVYNATGSYQCDQPSARDWKSVGRHITAGFALFDFINHDDPNTVASWGEGLKHGDLIAAFVERITPYKLSTINEVLTVCDRVKRQPRKVAGRVVPPGAHEFKTKHIHVVIPPDATLIEIMETIADLMRLAEEREKKAA